MAYIKISCTKCKARYKVNEEHIGKTSRCKRCGEKFVLLRPEESQKDGLPINPKEPTWLAKPEEKIPSASSLPEITGIIVVFVPNHRIAVDLEYKLESFRRLVTRISTSSKTPCKIEFKGIIPKTELLQILDIITSLNGDICEIHRSESEQLIKALTAKEEKVRASATTKLGEFSADIVVEALKQPLRDNSPIVRSHAVDSLTKIGRNLSNRESVTDLFIDALRKGEANTEVIAHIMNALRGLSLPAVRQAREVIKEKNKSLIDAKGGLKIPGFELEEVYVVITDIVDRKGRTVVDGISDKLRVENKCIYCECFSDPEFYDPAYPQGAGFCSLCYSDRDRPSLTYFDNSCDDFVPNRRSSWWLHSEFMAGIHPRVHVWWITYPDEEGLYKVR